MRVPVTEYVDTLDLAGEDIRVRFRTERGRLVDFMVQYETTIDGRSYRVVRYDGSHGRAHRDELDGRGDTIRKVWLPEHLTLNEAFVVGRRDIETNWRRYREAFRRRLGRA